MKSGFVAIVGPPNAGKSTFLNQVLGFKLAITSDKPQTTRHRLLGVHTTDAVQMIFLDTPGLHQGGKALNQRMVRTALEALAEVDAALFMVEASARGMAAGEQAARQVAAAKVPAVLALNKVDLVREKADLLPLMERAQAWGQWKALVPISALTGDGARPLLDELCKLLPEGGPLFDPETVTDLPERFLVAELVREKVFRLTGQEVPYAAAVTIDEFLEPEEPGRPTAISATIHVEREGQKAIVIGKGGKMIKRIGTEARLDAERLLDRPVYLNLFVRVEPNWSRSDRGLNKVGL